MTTVRYDANDFRLRVDGHAQAAEGTDPVCAGASALAWALVEAATNREEYNARLLIDPSRAVIDVQCFPTGRTAKRDCRYMFEVVMGGLQLISEAHPEFLRIKTGG